MLRPLWGGELWRGRGEWFLCAFSTVWVFAGGSRLEGGESRLRPNHSRVGPRWQVFGFFVSDLVVWLIIGRVHGGGKKEKDVQ